jgi:hypothetical protein
MKNSFEFPLLATVSKQLFLFYYEEEPQPPFVVRGKKREGVEEEIRPLLNN